MSGYTVIKLKHKKENERLMLQTHTKSCAANTFLNGMSSKRLDLQLLSMPWVGPKIKKNYLDLQISWHNSCIIAGFDHN